MKSYVIDNKYLLWIESGIAYANVWVNDDWRPLDVNRFLLQDLIDRVGLDLIVQERLGWNEKGSRYSDVGYFFVCYR